MDFALIFLMIEGVYILAAAGLGLALTKRGKPYKVLLPTFHVIFAVLIVAGMVSELLVGLPKHPPLAQILLSLAGLTLLGVVILGITMLVRKTRTFRLINAHKWLVIGFSAALVAGELSVLFKV